MTHPAEHPLEDSPLLERLVPKIAKGAGIIFIGTTFVQICTFAYGILLARVLGPGQLGIYSLGLAIVDRVAMLYEGRVRKEGTPEEFLDSEDLVIQAFVGRTTSRFSRPPADRDALHPNAA